MLDRLSVLIVSPGVNPGREDREFAGVAPGLASRAIDSIAQALCRLGHSVTIACDVDAISQRGAVTCIPEQVFSRRVNPSQSWDVAIFCDEHDAMLAPAVADLFGVWVLGGPTPAETERVGRVLALSSFAIFWSRYHCEQFEEADLNGRSFRGVGRFSLISPPGVDFEAISRVPFNQPTGGSEPRFLYAAAPEQGLDYLLQCVWPRIHSRYRNATLAVVSGDQIWRPSDQNAQFYNFCKDMISTSSGVVEIGVDSRPALWSQMSQSVALIHPTRQPELCNDIVIEAQALGLPVATADHFALRENLSFPETRIQEPFGTPAYAEAFTTVMSRLIEDQEFRKAAQAAGRVHVSADTFSWDALALSWSSFVQETFESRLSSQKSGLLRRLVSLGDFRAARLLVSDEECPEQAFDTLDLDDLGTITEQDRVIWEVRSRWGNVDVDASRSLAYEVAIRNRLENLLDQRADLSQPATILDVGGSAPRTILPWLGERDDVRLTILATDSEEAVRLQRLVEELRLEDRVKIAYRVDDIGPHDIVMICDLLQDISDLNEGIEQVERLARFGVCGSVPYGPWQRIRKDPLQIHHLAYRDVVSLLGQKTDFETNYSAGGRTARGEALGWWIFGYKTEPVRASGMINPRSRLGRIPPLPKVSATIMVKDEEENLKRCLLSIEDLVDEIILGDTGSTDETLNIAARMGYRFMNRNGRSRKNLLSLEFENFAQARNEIHQHADGDFVLWLDADEALIRGRDFRFWIDRNCHYDAFMWSMRSARVDRDDNESETVVRCFRRQIDGVSVRWIGCVHEVPSLGGNKQPSRCFRFPNSIIAHTGYLHEELLREKERTRNLRLLIMDRVQNPERRMGFYYGMRHYLNVANWEIEETQCMTSLAYKSLNYGFEIWRKHIADSEHFGKLGYRESRKILRLLGWFNMPLRSTGKVPFEADISMVAEVGKLEQDERLIPHSRNFYYGFEELRKEVARRLNDLERGVHPAELPRQVSTEIGESGAFLDCHLSPELFGLEPFPS